MHECKSDNVLIDDDMHECKSDILCRAGHFGDLSFLSSMRLYNYFSLLLIVNVAQKSIHEDKFPSLKTGTLI
ncbi:hypothetical protein VNO77_00670 [Canavalia gladiata]|uniref:Uncharacterized protein n=1 Tax=Canavalia gladiata TaxID=3824 RepID=A0AAN9MV53_CANGL